MTFWQCVILILETTPDQYNLERITKRLEEIEGVKHVHDLHVWALNNDKFSFTCHLLLHEDQEGQQQRVLNQADKMLRKKYSLKHNCI